MNRVVKTFIASVVSEIQQSDIYLTVKARLFETPGANLNGVRVTAGFLDEIVDNQQKYVGLPLCADVKNLAAGNYQHLGHLYDARTGEFYSAQIGSFYQFEKEETADGAALIGYVRIMKRNKAVCRAISELFADNALKFSFEISCGSYKKLADDTIEIDACEENFLEGAAVVTFPACESAVALDLVAECETIADGNREGENKMTDKTEISEMTAEKKDDDQLTETPPVEADAQTETPAVEQPTEVVSEVSDESEKTETPVTEETAEATEQTAEAQSGVAETEMAALHVRESTVEATSVNVYDDQTGDEVHETVTHETTTYTTIPTMASAQEAVAEAEPEDEPEEKQDEEQVTAEAVMAQMTTVIAELRQEIADLRNEISELTKKPEQIVAEVMAAKGGVANPFVEELKPANRYSLLEKEERPRHYSLLDRA